MNSVSDLLLVAIGSGAGEALPLLAYAAGSLLLGFAAAVAGIALGRAL